MATFQLYFVSFAVALGSAMFLTYIVRNLALAKGWARGPASDRHVHKGKIPRLGGVAIFASFLAVTAVACAVEHTTVAGTRSSLHIFLSLLIPGLVVFVSGLLDDIFDLSPFAKISAEILAGGLLFANGYRIVKLPALFGSSNLGFISSLALTIFWTLLITNAFNLIDGLDGLAAGSALFSTLTVLVVSLASHDFIVGLFSVVLAGATLGFLRYNFNPASIFLGDCGSLFIGFMLAALSLAGVVQQKSSTLIAVTVPIVAFGLPIVETTISVVRRFMNGQPLFTADRDHIHHKLLQLGCSQKKAVFLLYGISATFALLSLVLLSPGSAPVGLVLTIIGIGIAVGVQHLGYHEMFELTRIARRTIEQRTIIINNLAMRRGAEHLWSSRNFAEICDALDSTFRENEFDGFELNLTNSDGSCQQTHRWTREPDEHQEASTASAQLWTLVLELKARNGQNCGVLALHRKSSHPLLIDINLLTDEFQTALADACMRTTSLTKPLPATVLGEPTSVPTI